MTDFTLPAVPSTVTITDYLATYDKAMKRAAKAFRKAEKRNVEPAPEVYYDRDDTAVYFAEVAAEKIRELLALMPAVDEAIDVIETSRHVDNMGAVFDARDDADDLLGRIYAILIPPKETPA